MPTNINGGGGGGAGQNGDNAGGYSPNYANYLNQANVVQHQLEQFRMTNDGDANYMVRYLVEIELSRGYSCCCCLLN